MLTVLIISPGGSQRETGFRARANNGSVSAQNERAIPQNLIGRSFPNFEGNKYPSMYTYDTVSDAVSGLKSRGYAIDFNLEDNCLVCHDDKFDVTDFEIVEFYRFEGDSDPADEAVVYAIESNKGQKGVLVNGYGPSADPMSAEMAEKLHIHKN